MVSMRWMPHPWIHNLNFQWIHRWGTFDGSINGVVLMNLALDPSMGFFHGPHRWPHSFFAFDVSIDWIHGMDAPSQYNRNGLINGAIKWPQLCKPIRLAPSIEPSNAHTRIDSYSFIDGAIKCSRLYKPILLVLASTIISLAHFMASSMEPFILTRATMSYQWIHSCSNPKKWARTSQYRWKWLMAPPMESLVLTHSYWLAPSMDCASVRVFDGSINGAIFLICKSKRMGLYESIRVGAFDGSIDGTKQMGSYAWGHLIAPSIEPFLFETNGLVRWLHW